jgi:hypothetical protein
LCGKDRDWETENSKVCARTRDTRFIQVRVAKVANPTSYLGIKYGALRLVLFKIRFPARYPAHPLHSPRGGFLVGYKAGVLVGLHRTSPSRITGEF